MKFVKRMKVQVSNEVLILGSILGFQPLRLRLEPRQRGTKMADEN